MKKLSAKLILISGYQAGHNLNKLPSVPAHYCPGCGQLHPIPVNQAKEAGPSWAWDGNAENPSFEPSINIKGGGRNGGHYICHYFLKGGKLQYCSDTTHQFSGQTISLPEIPQDFLSFWEDGPDA